MRPTSGRVKEALFNILGEVVPDSRFLDLFAGTGNVGIEALSRGAAEAVFVEKDKTNIHIIEENLALTSLISKARLICSDVVGAMSLLGREGQVFDLVFLDPPYLKDFEDRVLEGIAANGLVQRDGMIIIESNKKDHLPRCISGLKMIRQETYGDTSLSFYQLDQATGEVI